MPGMYPPGEYDLAGFAVGVVEKERIIDGSRIAPATSSSGSRPAALTPTATRSIRRILERARPDLSADFHGRPFGDVILAPTRIYVKPVLAAARDGHGQRPCSHHGRRPRSRTFRASWPMA